MCERNSDKAAVMSVLSGNSEAYGDIVRRYKDMLFGVIYGIVKNYHTAEDLTQDTFIDGYTKLKSLGEPYNAGAWLAKIAKNKSYNYLTRSALRHESELHEYIQDTQVSTPENFLIEKQERQMLRQAVGRLPELYKAVINLYYFDNCPQNKIAELLKIPIGTVSRRLHDAKLKLKKELENMGETIKNVDFEEEVAKRIKSLKDYYHMNNFSSEGKDKKVEEFIKFVDEMPESKLKHNAYAFAYNNSASEELKSKAEKEAELGENANVYFDLFWKKYANKNSAEHWLKAIDGEEGIAKIKNWKNSEISVGEMYFWRGSCNMRLKNLSEAKKDFEEALKRLNRDNSYHPNAIACIKAIDILLPEYDRHISGVNMTGECYRLYDGSKKLDFVNQPGFGDSYPVYGLNRFDCIYYYASSTNGRTFFDLDMKEGESAGNDTLVSARETLSVEAGTFANCVHIRSVGTETWWKDMEVETWYAPKTGLIKCCVKENGKEEVYELCEYKINGGDGYFPAETGNLWRYKNVNLPEFYQQCNEYEIISVFDDPHTKSKYVYTAVFQILRASRENCDSDTHIALAEEAVPYTRWDEVPKKRDFGAAAKQLKLAVQKNTSARASLFAAIGVEYLERFRQYYEKGWHVSPCGLHSMSLIKDKGEGKIMCKSADYSIDPSQDWSDWWDERKCLARNPFRYLQQLFGVLYDDKWIAGYSGQIKHEHGEISIKAEDGGTIATKAGMFENCVKVTVELEKADETDPRYYVLTPAYSHCGTKVYYYAPNVGIVKYECIWGEALYACVELTEYKSYATDGEYMPVYIGSKWIYDEVTIAPEFMEKTEFNIVSGMEDEFFMVCEGEMLFRGTEDEFEKFKKARQK